MRLSTVSEAQYSQPKSKPGTIQWYLDTFFVHQPDAYDETGTRYYIVRDPYEVWLDYGRGDPSRVGAVELDSYMGNNRYGSTPTSLTVWRSNGTKVQADFLHDFGEKITIKRTDNVDLPTWVPPRA